MVIESLLLGTHIYFINLVFWYKKCFEFVSSIISYEHVFFFKMLIHSLSYADNHESKRHIL